MYCVSVSKFCVCSFNVVHQFITEVTHASFNTSYHCYFMRSNGKCCHHIENNSAMLGPLVLTQALYTSTTLTEYDKTCRGSLTLAPQCSTNWGEGSVKLNVPPVYCTYVVVPGWPRATRKRKAGLITYGYTTSVFCRA